MTEAITSLYLPNLSVLTEAHLVLAIFLTALIIIKLKGKLADNFFSWGSAKERLATLPFTRIHQIAA